MSKYRAGDQVARRKHTWLPCVLNEKLDGKSEEEVIQALKATWWADNITNSEWPALLGHEGASKAAKSRLKRKMVGWLMAQGRIAALNPELYNQAVEAAKALYLEQLGRPHPMFHHEEEE